MTANKIIRITALTLLISIALPASSAIVAPGAPLENTSPKTDDPRANQLLQRLDEIRSMNKSDLSRMEKKDLRKEVKGIKKEMKKMKGGVYLSVGAIIIVILLLILLLG
jgi:hypothetical protein